MARDAGVSYAVMAKTVRLLADGGYLLTRQGSAVRLLRTDLPETAPLSPPPQAHPFCPRWLEVARVLERDIVAGMFAPGEELPGRKQLAQRYGVCTQTLGQSLRELTSKGILEYARGRMRVPLLAGRAHSTVVVIARGQPGRLELPEGGAQYLRLLETLCMRSGVRLAPVLLGYRQPRLQVLDRRADALLSGTGQEAIVGYVVVLRGLPPRDVDPYIARAAAQDRPMAIIDHDRTGTTLRSLAAARKAVLLHPSSGHAAGIELGRHLLRRGHRSIAFVSSYHAEPWSRKRLAGLHEVFTPVGATVVEATTPAPDVPWRPLSVRTRLGTALGELARRHMPRRNALNMRLRRALPMIEDDIRRALMRQTLVESLRPVVRSTMGLDECTAVVAVNDAVALAWQALSVEQRAMRDRSPILVSFDNSRAAFTGGFTSYDFNEAAIAQAALQAVLRPDIIRAAPKQPRTIVVPGHVAARGPR